MSAFMLCPNKRWALFQKMSSTCVSLKPWLQQAHFNERRCSSPTRAGMIVPCRDCRIGLSPSMTANESPRAT